MSAQHGCTRERSCKNPGYDRYHKKCRVADCYMQVFGQVAVQIAAPTQAKVLAAQTLMTLQTKFPEQMSPLLSQLPQEQQLALQQLVTAG